MHAVAAFGAALVTALLHMLEVTPRAITAAEISAIREAFAVATVPGFSAPSNAQLSSLRVVSRCSCGCASVGFVSEVEVASLGVTLLADAEGQGPNGEALGLIVWGTSDQISGMEVHWGFAEGAPLPLLGSLRPWPGNNGA